jgi:hypothetical protein
LLRQITEKQAATYPPARQRAASLFPPRPVLVAVASTVLAVLLLFVGVVWYSGRFAGAPATETSLQLAEGDYPVNLPANIVPQDVMFTAKTSLSTSPGQAAVYEIESSDVTVASVTELGRKLGFSGQAKLIDNGTKIVMSQGSGDDARQLTVWTASGAVDYGYVEPEKLYPSYPAELPSQSEAELIAYNFLEETDLLPPGYGSFAKVRDETTVIAGGGYSVSSTLAAEATPSAPSAPSGEAVPEEPAAPSAPSATAPPPAPTKPTEPQAPTYWLVDFPFFIDGASATGPGSKIEVSVGDGGEVVSMLWSWRQMSPLGTDNIISQQQAFQDLTQGKGSIDIPLDCRQVIIEQVQLKYWLDPPSEQQDYAVPVYEFTGECLDNNGKTLEDFTAWTPALSGTN